MRSKPKSAPPEPLKELPKLDEHLCFALYAAGNHMTRLFVPFLKKLNVTIRSTWFLSCSGRAMR